jgi:hypothetical protein
MVKGGGRRFGVGEELVTQKLEKTQKEKRKKGLV